MVRKLFGALAVALLLCVSAVLADEIKGKITKVNVDKKTITVEGDDGKEKTLDVAADADLGKGRDGNARTLQTLSDQLEKAKGRGGDLKATVTYDKKGGKSVVS